MSCLLPIKVISISSPAVIRSLVQTSTPVQFSTLRQPGLVQSERLQQPCSRDRLHVQSVEVRRPFVSPFKEFLTLACFLSLFQSVPAQFPSVFGSDILKMILVAKHTDFPSGVTHAQWKRHYCLQKCVCRQESKRILVGKIGTGIHFGIRHNASMLMYRLCSASIVEYCLIYDIKPDSCCAFSSSTYIIAVRGRKWTPRDVRVDLRWRKVVCENVEVGSVPAQAAHNVTETQGFNNDGI